MLKTIAVIAAVLLLGIAAILAYAATRPDSFRIERTASIRATPEKILPHVSDLRAHQAWSPWEKKDPDMKRAYSGPAAGPGATYEWEGDGNIGQGRIRVTEASLSRVVFDMQFIKPFAARNRGEFILERQGEATRVTWSMSGPSPLVSKVMGLFFDMDQMIGGEFEAGLAGLKALTEQ